MTVLNSSVFFTFVCYANISSIMNWFRWLFLEEKVLNVSETPSITISSPEIPESSNLRKSRISTLIMLLYGFYDDSAALLTYCYVFTHARFHALYSTLDRYFPLASGYIFIRLFVASVIDEFLPPFGFSFWVSFEVGKSFWDGNKRLFIRCPKFVNIGWRFSGKKIRCVW